jgi:hypothetical protein
VTIGSKIPRKKIPELQTRYDLEPDLEDVYLEGSYDKEIFDSIFRSEVGAFRPCYSIDDIEVDTFVLSKHNLTSGNRQRVIALASELNLPKTTPVRFLVDRDFEQWLPSLPARNGLVTTKYTDAEVVFLTEGFVHSILVDAAKAKIQAWDEYFAAMKDCLRQLYCFRLELAARKVDFPLIDFRKCLNIGDGLPVLDIKSFVTRSLSKSQTEIKIDPILEIISTQTANLYEEPHQMVARGHDFLALTAWCIRASRGLKSLQSEEAIARILILFARDNADDFLEPIKL